MKTIIIDGEKLKQKVILELETEIIELKKRNIIPHLCVVQVGEHEASNIYISHKKRIAKKLNIKFTWIKLSNKIEFIELKNKINDLNQCPEIHGIIIQFPLPKTFSKEEVAKLVLPSKDADGIHPINQDKVRTGEIKNIPITCTPKGIIRILDEYNINTKNKNIVVLGRSRIVGFPMANLFKLKNANVKTINRDTSIEKKKLYLKNADIIVSATGYKDVFSSMDVKKDVIIIDVGIIRDKNKLRGDIKYKDFIGKASYITPVPGGVGPMTVVMLMSNVIDLAKGEKC